MTDAELLEQLAMVVITELKAHTTAVIERRAVEIEKQIGNQIELLRQRLAELEVAHA